MIWWVPIAAALPAFFLWDVVHEGSHALAALVCGRKVTSFKPWPHRTKDGFLFGRVTYDRSGNTFTKIAPYIIDMIAMAVFVLSFVFVGNQWARSALLVLLACPAVNTAIGVQARYRWNEGADLSRVHWGWALPFYYGLLAYLVILGWRVLPWVIGGSHG